jgi:hypothetical protein
VLWLLATAASALTPMPDAAVVSNVHDNADVNMDGVIKYVGVRNDRDPILQNIGGAVPTATRPQIGFQ